MFCRSLHASAGRDKNKATDRASSHCGSHGAERSGVPGVADAGRTRAAEGKACRQFFAPEGDLDVPSGFAKNGDTIKEVNLLR